MTDPSVVEIEYLPTAMFDAFWAEVTPMAPFSFISSPVVPLLKVKVFVSRL
jgi:hypothetical protein